MRLPIKRTVSLILAISMLLCTVLLISCSDKVGKMSLEDKYTIVVGKEIGLCESTAPKTLADALEKEGVTASIQNDSDAKKGEFEILVGLTHREESKQAYEIFIFRYRMLGGVQNGGEDLRVWLLSDG